MAIPNGTASPFLETSSASPNAIPPVVGINYGNSYASIAVFTKEGAGGGGVAECIANEDGERQIACALSFNGEEIVGPPATHESGSQLCSMSETRPSTSSLKMPTTLSSLSETY